jgi:hypothetical protein
MRTPWSPGPSREGPMEQPAWSATEPPPRTPRQLRLGLVGCGFQGSALATAATATAGVRLVACADPDAVAAASVAALAPDVSAHSSIEALLDHEEVDAVVVATPHHLLCPITLAAIRAGKHVLAEKPIGLNEHEAATIEAASRPLSVRWPPLTADAARAPRRAGAFAALAGSACGTVAKSP